MTVADFQWALQTFGPIVGTVIAGLVGIVLKSVRDELREVKAQTAPIAGVVAEVNTLGREMGERKDWERRHTDFHLEFAVNAAAQASRAKERG